LFVSNFSCIAETQKLSVRLLAQKLLTYAFGIYFFVSCAVFLCIAAVITLVTCLFDRDRKATHMFSCAWGSHYVFMNPGWHFKIEGRELIDPNKTYVLVANHQSYFDILAVYGLFKFFKWVSRDEIFSIPLVGGNMYLNQYVKLVRGKMSSIKQMLKDCRVWLDRGVSIAMFAEGTRSETGEMGPFRDGAFRLAIESGVPVVPVVIDGTFKVFAKRKRVIDFITPVRLKVLSPVDSRQFAKNTIGLRDHVHRLMEKTLQEMREEQSKRLKPMHLSTCNAEPTAHKETVNESI
jgi:1-acyl-sn-glycerol-3-phosphate acyltransferase